ncbi:methyltransferase [Rhodocytophaga rosea]|uniref:tRNA1(Val) (adenine(37)-N6)-methyltransferase n=1 Tax=Rhodocytophaga rosea TaxID=2704465 RepID=A0A6C0GDH6_9BACT|nr:methyltransferase [Rhodocytophaga rosea]QHT65812.1 methyltransferase [Rhodocytophaga rosea]
MPNDYFQFKEFRINQSRCAMKVCTDSCILGAYTPVEGAAHMLDIGTGTGLLALMLAQRSKAHIDAVEIDKSAYEQATENILESPFSSQIRVIHSSIQAFTMRPQQKYELIISNPPFFANHLKRKETRQNVALHSESLGLSELAVLVSYLLEKHGKFIVMLPRHEMSLLEEAAREVKLFPSEKLYIAEKQEGKLLRIISTFSFTETHPEEKDLFIKNESGTYTQDFIGLLQPYYLYM